MSTQDTDHIDPEYPGADEVRQFANRLRSTLGPEWIVDVGARRGDVPDEIVLMIRHPLVHGFQFGGDDVTELENAVGPFLRSEEYRLVQTFPAGRGTPDLVGHLRAGMGWWEIGPYQVFELCETLRAAGLLDWVQIEWLIRAGPLFTSWRPAELDEVEQVLGRIQDGQPPDIIWRTSRSVEGYRNWWTRAELADDDL